MEDLVKSFPESCEQAISDMIGCNGPDMNMEVTQWKDHYFMPVFLADTVQWLNENWQPRENDILTVTGQKSGTTWIREIIRQILYGNDEEMDELSKPIDYYLAYLESGKPSKWEMWNHVPLPRRYLQTHLVPSILDVEMFNKNKIIYLERDFKDQLVSFYHFSKYGPWIQAGKHHDIYSLDWDIFFKQHMAGMQPIHMERGNTFLDFNEAWKPYLNQENFLTVTYEGMKRDLPCEIRRIAAHIEVPISDDDVVRIVQATSINNMRKYTYPPLLRKGVVGDWKSLFTDEQSKEVDAMMKKCNE